LNENIFLNFAPFGQPYQPLQRDWIERFAEFSGVGLCIFARFWKYYKIYKTQIENLAE